jgi:transposase-like protein
LDIEFLQKIEEHRLPPRVHVIDHSPWLEELLRRVGLEYQKGNTMIRIFGYSPKNLEFFDE